LFWKNHHGYSRNPYTTMRICFYAPFKPLNHPTPSGDQVIARGLYRFLEERGHTLIPVSDLRTRWIYLQPWRLPLVLREQRRGHRLVASRAPDLWLTYHTYYKAPDLLGPTAVRRTGIPYVIFQGNYSTKRRRHAKTAAGFWLNRRALRRADHLFSNRREDYLNLQRLLPASRLTQTKAGIYPAEFQFDADARRHLRSQWGGDGTPVVITAAMFRDDVKSMGLEIVIRACSRILQRGSPHTLVIIGDGPRRDHLASLAGRLMPGRVRFVGKIDRQRMARYYSAGDLFAFPGINESLGMVYMEAQACGLPVVAFHNGGIPEVVDHSRTGTLVPLHDETAFADAVHHLLVNAEKRRRMGKYAAAYIRNQHDLNVNYSVVERILLDIAHRPQPAA